MSSDKKQQLIQAGIDLFHRRGFWNTSTASIAKHANVATGTLFNYFPSKESLIDEVYLHIKIQLLEELSSSLLQLGEQQQAKPVIEALWYRYISWGIKHPVEHELLNQLKLSDLVSKEAQDRGMASFSEFHQQMQNWLGSGELKAMDTGYLGELMMAQMQVNINYAIGQNLADMALAKHVLLGFAVFWEGIKASSD
ncbi:MAG: hypothetical protein OFPI_29450 [Osedax symbiont Rs2]|nr:MAG: hypothetical protein OFPI_29450 [Osedax symbiont Rs2]